MCAVAVSVDTHYFDIDRRCEAKLENMAAYYTRAILRLKGYYSSFNCRSTADTYERPTSSNRPLASTDLLDDEDAYKVERLISCRNRKNSNFPLPIDMYIHC